MTNIHELLSSWGMVVAYVVLNSFGAIAIKQTLQGIKVADLTSIKATMHFLSAVFMSPLALAGFIAIALSACAWIVALSRMEISVAYPVAVALNCLIVVTAGLALYGEVMNWNKLAGLGLLFCSFFLLFRA